VRGVEVIGLMHGQGLARGQRGAHRAGAGAVLAPFGAEIKARAAQPGVRGGVAEIVDGDAVGIGQQHDVAHLGHLAVQAFQAIAGDAREVVDALLMLAQPRLRHDARFLHAGGIEAVLMHAPLPRTADDGVVHARSGRRLAGGRQDHGFDVIALAHVHWHVHCRLLSP
jgi:hypothetical protein